MIHVEILGVGAVGEALGGVGAWIPPPSADVPGPLQSWHGPSSLAGSGFLALPMFFQKHPVNVTTNSMHFDNCKTPLSYACELRPVSRINVNKFTFMTLIFCRLCIH